MGTREPRGYWKDNSLCGSAIEPNGGTPWKPFGIVKNQRSCRIQMRASLSRKRPVSKRLEKIADEAAGRGRARQRQDEAGKGVIVESDGHGSS